MTIAVEEKWCGRHALEDVTNHRRLFHKPPPKRVSTTRASVAEDESPGSSSVRKAVLSPSDRRSSSGSELSCEDYVADMYSEWRRKELTWTYPNYLSGPVRVQRDLNAKMRAILVDWIVDVHAKFGLAEATLYLAVQIVDAYLARRPTARPYLQLVGITALLVASKYEDVEAPEICDCTYMCSETYSSSQVRAMELDILKAVDWNLTLPNAHVWLVRIMTVAGADAATTHAAEYLAQRLLLEEDVFNYRPSLVAAAAAKLALIARDPTFVWSDDLVALTAYDDLNLEVISHILAYYVAQDQIELEKEEDSVDDKDDFASVPPLLAVVNKFRSERFSAVAARAFTAVTPAARPAKRARSVLYEDDDDHDDDHRHRHLDGHVVVVKMDSSSFSS
ncbi:hypothetical protein CTAYLR_009847 [Chrysophaeum taylorii]|uniref:Cyclin N-terminal domain-containing protein n=1 Tax=Chrysophaeum taylorii TaxID=2483200 RepID=A0AAD7XJY5_9STRA|nr:hypothetical protein CTAYLR_009847 [Chrysophaeum taylorii]